MEAEIIELLVRAGIEAANKWNVTEKTQVMYTKAKAVEFCGLSYEKIVVPLETFTWFYYVIKMGYYTQADVLILNMPSSWQP
jgi:hypothetical protein